MFLHIFSILCVTCGLRSQVMATEDILQNMVPLGDAIVAAIESDVEQEEEMAEEQLQMFFKHTKELTQQLLNSLMTDADLMAFERLLQNIDVGRAGNFHKRRKLLKYLYPLLVGILIAKSAILPLILKLLTALSSTSFVLSKVALVTSGLLVLKWLFSGTAAVNGGYEAAQRRTRLEIIHLLNGKYRFGGGPGGGNVNGIGGNGNWADDLNTSGSNLNANSQQYTPLGAGIASSTGNVGMGGVAGRPYAAHHNYNAAIYDGKPFL